MSDNQFAELYERLTGAKVKKADGVFQRGWNAAIDFAIKQMGLACDEPAESAAEAAE